MLIKIFDGKKVYIGRVVPAEGKFSCNRGLAGEEQLCPASPVGKIGEADNNFFAHPQELQKNYL
jgi:hypothetical protein